MNVLQTFQKGDEIVRILQDDDPMSPREWDNLGIMVCSHSRYNLGDCNINTSFEEYLESEEINPKDIAVILPLYLYDHSGLSMSTGDFSEFDPQGWDSGQVGVIFVTKQKLRENYGMTKITKNLLEKAKRILQQEVKTYDEYLTGDVFGYEVIKKNTCDSCCHESEEVLDSCWGFYGDIRENGIYDELNLGDFEEIE